MRAGDLIVPDPNWMRLWAEGAMGVALVVDIAYPFPGLGSTIHVLFNGQMLPYSEVGRKSTVMLGRVDDENV